MRMGFRKERKRTGFRGSPKVVEWKETFNAQPPCRDVAWRFRKRREGRRTPASGEATAMAIEASAPAPRG